VTPSFDSLAATLIRRFRRGVAEDLDDATFDDLARAVFAHQFETNRAYRAFCVGRGVTPEGWPGWAGVPPVPAAAFKHLDLLSGDPGRVEAEFLTSGTSRGAANRGRHPVPSLRLYREAALPNLEAHLLPGLEPPVRILSLIPSVEAAPHSSLARMMGFALEAWGDEGSRALADPRHGVDVTAVGRALDDAVAEGRPVWIAGTAFAFVHWLDAVERGEAAAVRLPEGARLMETGGFKGRSREVPRAELYAALSRALGIEPGAMVNEYGMTELLSQFYEPVLGAAPGPAGGAPDLADRHHRGPPWVRTRILDPETLAPLPPGAPGLLCHHDLANLGSVAAVLTEDVGVAVGDGFRLLGRVPGAEPRGCSLALEELLS
jgi:hypothetical protein